MIWTIYSGSIGILFLIVKLLNCRFHYLFDTTEPIEEPVPEESANPSPSKNDASCAPRLVWDRPKNLGFAEA